MKSKLKYSIALSASLLVAGCASMGKDGRIGKNDGTDPCYIHLDRIDNVAAYYNDDRTKTIIGGSLMGAATGAGIAALAKGDTTAILASAAAGTVVGGFAASAYWDNKLKEAHNARDQAIEMVSQDLRTEIGRLDQLDQDIAKLVQCRTKARDKIRKDYMDKAITRDQAQALWSKLGELTRKDAKEMSYLDDALNNLEKLGQAYQSAASAIDSPESIDEATLSARRRAVEDEQEMKVKDLDANAKLALADINRQKLAKQEKNRKIAEAKRQHKEQREELVQHYQEKTKQVNKKINPKSETVKSLVSASQEKRESIKKNKNQVSSLAAETANKNGFEEINSHWWPNNPNRLATQPASTGEAGLSCLMVRPESAAGS